MSEIKGQERPLVTATDMVGDDVINLKEETIGKVEDVVLDVATGEVAYVVMSFGAWFGIGGKLFAIPFHSLTFAPVRGCFVLDADKAKVERAPGFSRDDWPDYANPTWADNMFQYWGPPLGHTG